MKLTAVVLTTFALGPAIVLAWAKDGSTGAWVANNKWYQWDGVGGCEYALDFQERYSGANNLPNRQLGS